MDDPTAPKSRPLISRAEWGLLLVLSAIQFTHILDFVIIMPLAPMAMSDLKIGPKEFGLLVSVYGFAACVSSLIASMIMDRFDRKKSLLFLYAGFTVSTLLCGIATDYETLVAARTFAGAFGGVVAVAIMAIVGDVFADYRRGTATGAVMSAFAVASIAGIPAGLLLADRFGLNAPFLFLSALSFAIFLVAMWLLPSLRGHLTRDTVPATTRLVELLREPNHQRAFAFMGALVLGTFMVVPYIGAYMVANAGRTVGDLPYVYLCGGLCTLVSMNIIGRLSDRYGKLKMFRIMAVLSLIMTGILTNLPPIPLSLALVVASAFMIATSGRMVPAGAMMTACAAPQVRGGFLSLNTAFQHLATGVAAIAAGQLLEQKENGPLRGYPLVGALGMVAAVVGIYLAGKLRSAETPMPVVGEIGPEAPILE
jgi:predicted MFS family arabinose efflux permease